MAPNSRSSHLLHSISSPSPSISFLLRHRRQKTLANPTTPKTLLIPEILELILAYLTPWHARAVASLVCKQWLAVTRRVAPLQAHLVLNGDKKCNDEAFRKLTGEAHTLVISVLPTASIVNNHTRECSVSLMDRLKDCNKDKVFSLKQVIFQSVELWWGSLIMSAPTLFQSLTSLCMEKFGPPQIYSLDFIFQHCSALENLSLAQGEKYGQAVSAAYERHVEPLGETRLRRLVLRNMTFTQRGLERLVEACPKLEVLEVNGPWSSLLNDLGIDANSPSALALTSMAGIHSPASMPLKLLLNGMDQERLYELVAATCPKMRRFHCSINIMGDNLVPADLNLLKILFPTMTEWSFLDSRINLLAVLNPILSMAQHLTFLEFVRGPEIGKEAHEVLHEILCDAPQLIHLLAPRLVIYFDQVDLHGYLDYYGRPRWPRSRPDLGDHIGSNPDSRNKIRLWACRKLQTLSVSFCARHGGYRSPWGSVVAFGYLARCCPDLRDLRIGEASLAFSGADAFGLLGRLRRLERLYVHAAYYPHKGEVDLGWLRRRRDERVSAGGGGSWRGWKTLLTGSGERKKDEERIRVVVGEYEAEGMLREYETQLLYRQRGRKGSSPSSLSRWSLIVDGLDITDLGSVNDLMVCLEEQRMRQLQKNPDCTWPRLESFRVDYCHAAGLELAMEKAQRFLEEERPEVYVEFRCFEYREFMSQ